MLAQALRFWGHHQEYQRHMKHAEALLREALALLEGTPSVCWEDAHEKNMDLVHYCLAKLMWEMKRLEEAESM